MSSWNPRANDLFLNALVVPDAAARRRYLDEACGGDGGLRAQVEAMLAASQRAGTFLDRPAAPPPDPATVAHSTFGAGDRVGPYKLLEKIGEGGMGEVWVADQTEPIKRRVALKLIKPGMDSRSVLGRFEAERQALAVMDHPNIARVLDAGTTADGRPFFVMELVKGTPITEFADARRLTPKQRLELFVPVCQAIQHAHMKGVIHRDIKPSNVLVCLHDETPVPKVIDFGVAKAVGQQLTDKTIYTGFGALIGTPAYMAPEQATFNQLDVDTRADVYALGVLLYELLAGSPPIDKERLKKAALDEVLRIVRDEEPPRPSQRLSTSEARATIAATRGSEPAKLSALMRGELDWIVMKALEKDRGRRYETANGLAADVRRYLSGEPVRAVPPSAGYRLKKFVRKNRGPVIAGAAVVLALIAGVVGTTLGLIEAKRQESRAVAEAGRAGAAEKTATERLLQVEAEKERAETERKSAQAVRDFLLKDLLKQADVIAQAETQRLGGGGFATKANPTVLELLDRAAAGLTPDKIDARFPGQPLVQAEILETVGRTYTGTDQPGKAVSHLTRAAELYEKLLGPDAPATLSALHALANAYNAMSQTDKSIPLFERVRDARTASLGADDRDTLETRIYLGLEYLNAGRLDDGVATLEAARAAAVRKYGPGDMTALTASYFLVPAYQFKGQMPEAVKLAEEVWEQGRRQVAADHPYIWLARTRLALVYLAAGRHRDAIPLLEALLTDGTNWTGPGFRGTTPQLVAGLVKAYRKTGQPDHALGIVRRGIDGLRRDGWPTDRASVHLFQNLANALLGLGRYEEGLALVDEVLPRIRKVYGADHNVTLDATNLLAILLELLGRYERGAEVAREVLTACRAQAKPNRTRLGTALEIYGRCLVGLGRPAEAEPLFRELLAICETFPPGHWGRYGVRGMIGGALAAQKKYAEAEPLLLSGYEGMKRRVDTIPPEDLRNLPDTADSLIELYTATGRPAEAAKWRAERARYPFVAPPPREKK